MAFLAALLAAACVPGAPAPADANAYVRALVSAQRVREEALSLYTYDVAEVREDLDAGGRAARRETKGFEVFFVRGRPVRRLVERDGRPLPAKERAREDARARQLADDLAAGRSATEQPGLRISRVLERYDFAYAGREDVAGRCALAFDVAARPGRFDLDRDALLRRLAGRLWVDEEDRAVVRLQVRNTGGLRVGLGIAASVSSLGLEAEFARMEDGVWLPRRVEARAEGRKLLFASFRVRTTTTYSNYRRFAVDVEERVAP
ncbi:MAG: hypothetical protein U0599_10640 [Vicinamibacteria bacterium]